MEFSALWHACVQEHSLKRKYRNGKNKTIGFRHNILFFSHRYICLLTHLLTDEGKARTVQGSLHLEGYSEHVSTMRYCKVTVPEKFQGGFF